MKKYDTLTILTMVGDIAIMLKRMRKKPIGEEINEMSDSEIYKLYKETREDYAIFKRKEVGRKEFKSRKNELRKIRRLKNEN